MDFLCRQKSFRTGLSASMYVWFGQGAEVTFSVFYSSCKRPFSQARLFFDLRSSDAMIEEGFRHFFCRRRLVVTEGTKVHHFCGPRRRNKTNQNFTRPTRLNPLIREVDGSVGYFFESGWRSSIEDDTILCVGG